MSRHSSSAEKPGCFNIGAKNRISFCQAGRNSSAHCSGFAHSRAFKPRENAAAAGAFSPVLQRELRERAVVTRRRTLSSGPTVGGVPHPMTPSTAKKGSIRYRYYVSLVLAQARRSEAGTIARVSAPEVEAVVVDALRASYPDDAALEDRALIEGRGPARQPSDRKHRHASVLDSTSPIEIAWSRPPPLGRREILASRGSEGHDRGIKAEARTVLLRSIALGRRWLDEVLGGATIDEIADRERCTKRHGHSPARVPGSGPGKLGCCFERAPWLVLWHGGEKHGARIGRAISEKNVGRRGHKGVRRNR